MSKKLTTAGTLLALLVPNIAFADSTGFPAYLANDPYFWLFSVLSVIAFAAGVWLLLFALETHARPFLGNRIKALPPAVTIILGAAVAWQSFHMYEHVAQLYQYRYLGLKGIQASGILFFMNLEWNHFIFDSTYFVTMVIIASILIPALRRENGGKFWNVPNAMLIAFIVFSTGVHAFEHTVRITEHVMTGCEPCKGTIDRITGWPLIYIHFVLNVIAELVPMSAFFWYGCHRQLLGWVRRMLGKEQSVARGAVAAL